MLWSTKKFTRERLSLKMLRQATPVLNPLAQEQIKQRILLFVQNQPAAASAQFMPSSPRFHFARLGTAFAFGILAVVSTAYASTASNPGDVLYSVKRVSENFRLTLAPSEEAKAKLQAAFAHERISEFKKIKKPEAPQKNKTRSAAKREVTDALSKLNVSENNLKQQGKIQASALIQEKINVIKREANEQNLIEEFEEN